MAFSAITHAKKTSRTHVNFTQSRIFHAYPGPVFSLVLTGPLDPPPKGSRYQYTTKKFAQYHHNMVILVILSPNSFGNIKIS